MSTLHLNTGLDEEYYTGFIIYDDRPVVISTLTPTFAVIEYGEAESYGFITLEITGTNLDSTSGEALVTSVRAIGQGTEPGDEKYTIFLKEGISFQTSIDDLKNQHEDYDVLTDMSGRGFDTIFANAGGMVRLGPEDNYLSFENTSVYIDDNWWATYPQIADTYGGDDTILGSGNVELFHGGSGNDVLIGLAGYDDLRGDSGDDLLRGGRGDDKLYGGSGSDTLIGAKDEDLAFGAQGSDSIRLGSGDDHGRGSAGDDTLLGGRGDDIVQGGKGDDVIVGGAGDDLLMGGRGADVFAFRGATDDDVIAGFDARGGDKIKLTAFSYDGFDDLIAKGGITAQSGNTVITLDRGTITLKGISADEITADDFIF